MRVLVITRPKHYIPPQELPGLMQAFAAWREKYRAHMEAFEFFLGGGGCGILNFPDELSLQQCWLEYPFGFMSDNQFHALIPGDQALAQFQRMLAAMGPQHA